MTHKERMDQQQHELTESLVDNYNLDTVQKAIMVEDSDLVLEKNRAILYERPKVGEDGVMFFPKETKEGEEDVSGERRSIQIGNNFHEHIETKPNGISKYIPLAAAGLVGSGLIAAALLWPRDSVPTIQPVDTDTNTISAVRIIE